MIIERKEEDEEEKKFTYPHTNRLADKNPKYWPSLGPYTRLRKNLDSPIRFLVKIYLFLHRIQQKAMFWPPSDFLITIKFAEIPQV